jgi:acetylornithine deacetylase/succinyl-diaminopimelate desuccinylase-like protein
MRRGRRETAAALGIPVVAAPGWACNVACMAPTTTEILAALVGFNTTSRNSNLALIGWVRAYMDHPGVACRIIPDTTGGKANLHAVIGPHTNSTGKVSYGTAAGAFQAAGIPAIVCGPGDITQAHQPDEWIAASELAACDDFIRRLAARMAA